jgi:hypothetical protein
LADKDRHRWLELLSYIAALIYNEREEQEREPLIEKVADAVPNDAYRQEVFAMGKTIAEGLIEKGHQQGYQKGRQEERVQMLVRLLKNRFGKIPAATLKRIEATEQAERLEAWFDQASSAKKLEDVAFDSE